MHRAAGREPGDVAGTPNSLSWAKQLRLRESSWADYESQQEGLPAARGWMLLSVIQTRIAKALDWDRRIIEPLFYLSYSGSASLEVHYLQAESYPWVGDQWEEWLHLVAVFLPAPLPP